LLYFFNPVLTSRNALLQATQLDKVQAFCGSRPVSAGSFTEAQHLFDPILLQELVSELAERVPQAKMLQDWDVLKNLTAVDGSLWPALPRMVWALWQDDEYKAARMHVPFEVLRGIPVGVTLTSGNAVWEVIEERPVNAAAAAGVRSDRVVWLDCALSKQALRQPLLAEIRQILLPNSGEFRYRADRPAENSVVLPAASVTVAVMISPFVVLPSVATKIGTPEKGFHIIAVEPR
jgi:hypothetical protein